jgi:hypothetical protein
MSQSQPQQIVLSNLRNWLQRETASIVEPMENKATNLFKDMRQRLDDVLESTEKMVQNSESEMEKASPKTHRYARNANKLANMFSETIRSITVPERASYQNLETFINESEKALALIEQQRREGYPYIAPYFIFDRRKFDVMLKRVIDGFQDTRTFFTTKYSRIKAIEEINGLIDKLSQTINQTEEIKKDANAAEQEEILLGQQIIETKQKIMIDQGKPELKELVQTDQKIDELRETVKHALRHLQKPFYKLQSLAKSGEIALPIDESKKLEEYLKEPFEAFVTEEEGYPTLKSILKKLDDIIVKNKLKLKSSRMRKAQEQIEIILNKAYLNELYKNCAECHNQRKKLLASTATMTAQNELYILQSELKELQKRKELATSRKQALNNEYIKLIERTQNLKIELERGIFQLTNNNVKVGLGNLSFSL